MNIVKFLFIGYCLILPATTVAEMQTAINTSPLVSVSLEAPSAPLKMGDVPFFTGKVTNNSSKTLHSLIVYLSLVSLQLGQEHPVDLEDWSARKAIRLERLAPGETDIQKWKMRLIKSGPFGAALTIIDPQFDQPGISPLTVFNIAPKPTVVAGRILPVAIGVPLLLAGMFIFVYRMRR